MCSLFNIEIKSDKINATKFHNVKQVKSEMIKDRSTTLLNK